MSEDQEISVSPVRIRTVTVQGAEIGLPARGVTAIVGGNNSGKTTLIDQIYHWLGARSEVGFQPSQFRILDRLELEQPVDKAGFAEWLHKNVTFKKSTVYNSTQGYVRGGMQPMAELDVLGLWDTVVARGHLGELVPIFVHKSSGGSGPGFNAPRRSRPGEVPQHVVHYLQDDPDLFDRIDNLYFELFGGRLTLDKLTETITLRVGSPPESLGELTYNSAAEDETSAFEELERMPLVADQGSGVQSILNSLISVATSAYPIILLDEPEAYLHPPQAVKLGRILGELTRSANVQVILATHDRNVLVGLLQSEAELTVIRLARNGDATTAHSLPPEAIKSVWSDPVLRYSNVLDGLFHSLVVMAENERDCTFYAAALDSAHAECTLTLLPSEVLFIPTGGKDGQAPVAVTLVSLKVPIVACTDIDILREKAKVKKLVSALGASWAAFESEYEACTRDLNTSAEPATVTSVAEAIQGLLEKLTSQHPRDRWNSKMRDQVLAAIRVTSSKWEHVKEFGIRAFPSGLGARPMNLLDQLDAIGLVIVREGELESFGRGFNNMATKQNWLRSALANEVHQSEAAKSHVRRFISAYDKLRKSP
ncbi:ATP-dependent nuclease [Actinokineospora sp. HUAS TT18]|uniref:ATP-dependent nuclease n=1 Tax=Actinokineospora sp. HUAS TT18 TaxID=3447451 RepID=UPI003F5260E9